MRYCVAITNAQYGNAYVEAESPEEAKQKARDMYEKRQIDWYEDELMDLDPHPEEYPVDGVRCPRCGVRLYKSAVPGYVYQCYECDEDFYSFEAVTRGGKAMKKEVFNIDVTTRIQITKQDIDDIMVAALEGGITYWADTAEVPEDRRVDDWGHEQIARGGVLRIHTTEPLDMDDTEWYELTREKLLDGIKKAYEGGYYTHYGWCNGQTLDCCQVDAEVADAIVQLALFGEVVYG